MSRTAEPDFGERRRLRDGNRPELGARGAQIRGGQHVRVCPLDWCHPFSGEQSTSYEAPTCGRSRADASHTRPADRQVPGDGWANHGGDSRDGIFSFILFWVNNRFYVFKRFLFNFWWFIWSICPCRHSTCVPVVYQAISCRFLSNSIVVSERCYIPTTSNKWLLLLIRLKWFGKTLTENFNAFFIYLVWQLLSEAASLFVIYSWLLVKFCYVLNFLCILSFRGFLWIYRFECVVDFWEFTKSLKCVELDLLKFSKVFNQRV